MQSRQLSIRSALGLIFCVAVLFAIYLYNDWAAFMLLFNSLLILYLGILATVISTTSDRSTFLSGFSVFGIGYLLLSGSMFRQFLFPSMLFQDSPISEWTSYPALGAMASQVEIPAWPSILDLLFSLVLAAVAGIALDFIKRQSTPPHQT
jgi:hypothetical protein